MAQVVIVYAADYGSAEKMAGTVGERAASVEGVTVRRLVVDEVGAGDLLTTDALVVDTPVHMGDIDWRVKKFIDTVCSGLFLIFHE